MTAEEKLEGVLCRCSESGRTGNPRGAVERPAPGWEAAGTAKNGAGAGLRSFLWAASRRLSSVRGYDN